MNGQEESYYMRFIEPPNPVQPLYKSSPRPLFADPKQGYSSSSSSSPNIEDSTSYGGPENNFFIQQYQPQNDNLIPDPTREYQTRSWGSTSELQYQQQMHSAYLLWLQQVWSGHPQLGMLLQNAQSQQYQQQPQFNTPQDQMAVERGYVLLQNNQAMQFPQHLLQQQQQQQFDAHQDPEAMEQDDISPPASNGGNSRMVMN